MRIKVAVKDGLTLATYGAMAIVAGALLLVVWAYVTSSLNVNRAIESTEDPIERSNRLTKEAEAYLRGLEQEREWRKAQIEKIKREQGIE